MRYAKTDNGQRRFTMDKFLTAQQIQAYFSRTSAKLRHTTAAQSAHDLSTDDSDIQAAQDEEAYSSTLSAVLDQCRQCILSCTIILIYAPCTPPPAGQAQCSAAAAHLQSLQYECGGKAT